MDGLRLTDLDSRECQSSHRSFRTNPRGRRLRRRTEPASAYRGPVPAAGGEAPSPITSMRLIGTWQKPSRFQSEIRPQAVRHLKEDHYFFIPTYKPRLVLRPFFRKIASRPALSMAPRVSLFSNNPSSWRSTTYLTFLFFPAIR
jgi:hypothetical protein